MPGFLQGYIVGQSYQCPRVRIAGRPSTKIRDMKLHAKYSNFCNVVKAFNKPKTIGHMMISFIRVLRSISFFPRIQEIYFYILTIDIFVEIKIIVEIHRSKSRKVLKRLLTLSGF